MSELLTLGVCKLRGFCFRKVFVENYFLFINEMENIIEGATLC